MTDPEFIFADAVVTRWIANEPQPGLIEVALTDADDRVWVFEAKWPMFITLDSDIPNPDSKFPYHFAFRVAVMRREMNRMLVSTADPAGVGEVTANEDQFWLRANQVRDVP